MNTYIEGWRLGLKAIAIYRDGSKRSAPLNVKKTKDMGGTATDAVEAEISTKEELEGRIRELEAELGTLRAKADRPVRNRMPETRVSLTHKFDIAGHEGYLTVGLYENHQPGEIFIQMAKEGSTIGGLMDTVATLTSIALQYGVPLESLVRKFAYQRFEPSGFTKNPDIRNATSITDYVFRWLGCHFIIKGYKEATSPTCTAARTSLTASAASPRWRKRRTNWPRVELPAHRREGSDRHHHQPRQLRGDAERKWQRKRPCPRGGRPRRHAC